MQKVAKFDNLISFCQIWNYLPHSDPENFLTIYDNSINKFIRAQYSLNNNNDPKRMIAVCVFKENIEPLWEDKENIKGGEFTIIKTGCTKEKYKELWDRIVFMTIGSEFEYSENITGVRIIDRTADYELCYKYEVWVNFSEAHHHKEKMDYFMEKLREIFDDLVEYKTHAM